MGTIYLRAAGAGLFYVFIFLSGMWLSRSGKPFNTAILTIHKLISLAAVAFLVFTMSRIDQAAELGATEWTAGAVTGLFFLGAIISGGLVSTGKPMPAAVSRIHRVTPYLSVLSSVATLYLLLIRT